MILAIGSDWRTVRGAMKMHDSENSTFNNDSCS